MCGRRLENCRQKTVVMDVRRWPTAPDKRPDIIQVKKKKVRESWRRDTTWLGQLHNRLIRKPRTIQRQELRMSSGRVSAQERGDTERRRAGRDRWARGGLTSRCEAWGSQALREPRALRMVGSIEAPSGDT